MLGRFIGDPNSVAGVHNANNANVPPPASLASCKLWLSASATSSLALSGSTVTGWTDLAHATACTVTGSPTYDATAMGGQFPGVKFSSARINAPIGALLAGATSYAVILVAQDTATSATYMFEYGNNGAGGAGMFVALTDYGSTDGLDFFSPVSGNANRVTTASYTAQLTNMGVLTFASDFTKSSGAIAAPRLNGDALSITRPTDASAVGTSLVNDTLYIGGGHYGNYWPGTIGDIVVLANPAAGDIATVEEYFQ